MKKQLSLLQASTGITFLQVGLWSIPEQTISLLDLLLSFTFSLFCYQYDKEKRTPNPGFCVSGADGITISSKSLMCFGLVRSFVNFVLSKEKVLFY